MQLKRADHVRMSRKGRRRLHWRSGHVARFAGTRSVSLFEFAARLLYGSQSSSTSSFSAVSAANFALVSAASMQNSVLQKGCQSISAMWRRVLCICMLQASCMCTSQASLRAPCASWAQCLLRDSGPTLASCCTSDNCVCRFSGLGYGSPAQGATGLYMSVVKVCILFTCFMSCVHGYMYVPDQR